VGEDVDGGGGVDLDGGRAGGVDLNGGGSRCGAEEERSARHQRGGGRRGNGVEAADAASRRMRRRSGHRWVCGGEMTVARVRVRVRGAAHLKRRIVAMGGVDYVSAPIAIDE
jgi:hypothetical protein